MLPSANAVNLRIMCQEREENLTSRRKDARTRRRQGLKSIADNRINRDKMNYFSNYPYKSKKLCAFAPSRLGVKLLFI
jgi:hypothetical protein